MGNNKLSDVDKSGNDANKTDGYLASPNGQLTKYDHKTQKTSIVSSDLPSDPNDPDRKNKIQPKLNTKPKSTKISTIENKNKDVLREEKQIRKPKNSARGNYYDN